MKQTIINAIEAARHLPPTDQMSGGGTRSAAKHVRQCCGCGKKHPETEMELRFNAFLGPMAYVCPDTPDACWEMAIAKHGAAYGKGEFERIHGRIPNITIRGDAESCAPQPE